MITDPFTLFERIVFTIIDAAATRYPTKEEILEIICAADITQDEKEQLIELAHWELEK